MNDNMTITCSDGHPLAASVYTPTTPTKAAVMIGPATGIKRQFYHNFANHLAQQGYGVITFDNRGIGESQPVPINESEADLVQWGRLDMTAVLRTLQTTFPSVSYHLIGHSAGGQLVGLMDNAESLTSMFAFASSSGQLRNMAFKSKFKAHFFMNTFIPLSNMVFGHTKSQWLGMGEPLPKKVARQWQKWCNGQGYVKTDFNRAIDLHLYDKVNFPALWVNASDDFIALDINVDDMLSVYTEVNAQRVSLEPKSLGLKDIGHMKFFSRQCQSLWPLATDWLEQHSTDKAQAS